MPPLFSKNTPSVFCLIFTLFSFVTPFFAQTPAIEAADKALDIAKKDKTNVVSYATALRDVWQAYRDFIVAEKVGTSDTLNIFLLTQDTAYRLSKDALVNASMAVKGRELPKFWNKIQAEETALYQDMVKSCDQIGVFYAETQGNHVKSLRQFEFLQVLYSKLGDKENYFSNIETLGNEYRQAGKNEVAQTILEKAIAELNPELTRYDNLPKLDKGKPENLWLKKARCTYIDLIATLSAIFQEKGNFEAAVINGKKAVYLMKECLKDTNYQAFRYDAIVFGFPQWRLAHIYYESYKLDSAILIATEALLYYPKVSREHSLLSPLLTISYSRKGDMANFRKMVMETYEFAQGEEQKTMARSILFLFYLRTGQYDEAAKWRAEDNEACLKFYGKDTDRGDASPTSSTGTLYRIMGEFDKAEKCFKKALSIYKKLGASRTRIVSSEEGLAMTYDNLGQYDKSFAIKQQTHAHVLANSFENSQERISSWERLGYTRLKLGQLDSSRFCYEKCYAIFKALGEKKDNFVHILNQLGVVEERQHNYSAAEKWYQEAQAVTDSIQIVQPKDKGIWLSNFSQIFRKRGQYAESLKKSEKSLEILRGLENTDNYHKAQLNRALLHDAQQQNAAAIDSLQSLWQNIETRIVKEFGYLSEPDKVAFMTMLDGEFFGTMQAAYARLYAKGEAAKSGALFYNTALLQKELSLVDTRSLKRKVANLNDTLLFAKLFKLNAFEEQIKSDKPIPTVERERLVTEITQIKADLEKNYPKLFEKEWLKINWQSIKQKLKKGEIAIEFTDVLNNDDDTTSIRNYYAIIVKADSEYPTLVPLFEEHALTKILEESLVKQIINRPNLREVLIDDAETMKKRYGTKYGKLLYNLVWQPLENAQILRGVKRVHFAPSGLLYRVSFAALPANDTLKTLLENYELRQYNSTRDITETTPRTPDAQEEAVLFGGIRYNNDSISIAEVATQLPENDITSRSRSALLLDSVRCWGYLPQTLREVKTIDSLYKKLRPTVKTSVKTGIHALEENAKAVSKAKGKSPRLLHFATHSFANPSNYVESRYAAATLHRAGLVMANADWQGCKHQKSINDMDDGILTAFEIAQLNLSNTELVVMSSCQSALGDISSGREGVFGLTRGFKLAGVEYVLASLWKVNDSEAAEFMTTFYNYYLTGKTPVEAFELTQKESKKSDKGVDAWAAWVLIR